MNYLDRADDVYEEIRDEAWLSQHVEVVKLPRYNQNLRLEKVAYKGGNVYRVYSYNTLVATGLEGGALMQSQWYSTTTQKHVNYVARELNMELIKLF